MKYQTGGEFFPKLPLILAGPILQHTEPESVTVWIALKHSCQVELKVYETTNHGEVLGNCLLQGTRSTCALGRYLHIVAVTARSKVGDCLTNEYIYAYDLEFTIADQSRHTLQQALCSSSFPDISISYFGHQKPTFVLPPNRLPDLRIVHASCRKPHGHGFDALPILDGLIAATANQPRKRPHQLFLTGDQIYGDDVAAPSLWVASTLGDALLGWEEQLPVGQPNNVCYVTPQELPPGERAKVATVQAGFTAGFSNKTAKVSSHLLSLGEYYATYLLAWSPVCWPHQFPQGKQVTRDRTAIRHWNQAVRDLRQFIYTLGKVRRAIANTPTYSIFDDHDVTDDWNLNQAWCLRVLGMPLGRRVVQNALLAYAVFQAWGNTPKQFTSDQPGEKLLLAAQAWSDSQGTDTDAYNAIARYVGMPATDPRTSLPCFVPDGEVLILDRDSQALTWNYTVRSHCHEVIVLDTRTWRGYSAEDKAIAPPMLLCPQALKQQLQKPLQQTSIPTNIQATFIVAPTNVFGLKVIDWVHHCQLRSGKVFSTDVGDGWNIHTEALAQFLTTIFNQRQQVIILSGDIHYGCVGRLSYQPTNVRSPSILVHLTASALKNEETLTRLIHTRLKDWLLPEKVRHWIGWKHPPDMVELSARRKHNVKPHPDWHCTLEWIPRDRIQTPRWQSDISSLITPWKRAQTAKWQWLQPLIFWQSRWFQEGREVVGLNNIALVQFESAEASSSYKVMQDLYWLSSWYPTRIVYSRFETQMIPNSFLAEVKTPG
ncbi:MAG: PhoD-like phosphatase [Goleter apudmare HA4340-LM2]|jgi:hypothetical protein|nr:PhoD-like phosphatase [Goleter apudmare HA4340-LM2]